MGAECGQPARLVWLKGAPCAIDPAACACRACRHLLPASLDGGAPALNAGGCAAPGDAKPRVLPPSPLLTPLRVCLRSLTGGRAARAGGAGRKRFGSRGGGAPAHIGPRPAHPVHGWVVGGWVGGVGVGGQVGGCGGGWVAACVRKGPQCWAGQGACMPCPAITPVAPVAPLQLFRQMAEA